MARPVELIAKVKRQRNKKDLSEEDLAFLNAQKIINPDYKDEDSEEVGFKRLIIDLELISDALELDPGYVQIITKLGVVYVLRIDYELYKDVFQRVMQTMVLTVHDVND